ncbi:MAG: LPS export ABC transporter periplasmic protein LptC [Paludibacteraceae bacterium]|nr:LPS export ABC transporter periplasmic protein LptC [Paludibacteraceae bacterium]
MVVILVLSACSSSIKNDSKLTSARDSLAIMRSYNIVTLVSDSGVTRYRVETPEWLVYDKAERPYWLFPQGLHMDRFDEFLNVYSRVDAKYAIYFTNDDVWELYDSVRVTNVHDECFETDKLIAEPRNDKIYTDQFVKVTQKDRIITGIGMHSNKNLTRYVIEKTQGVIPLDEEQPAANTAP